MPKRVARLRLRGESSPSRRASALCETSACTAAERPKPSTRGQKTSQAISNASLSAWPTPNRIVSICVLVEGSNGDGRGGRRTAPSATPIFTYWTPQAGSLRAACTGGQGTLPYEQKTQQSPGRGRSVAAQRPHL